jgi:competence protein ComEC
MEKQKAFAWTAGLSLSAFMILRGLSFANAEVQRKVIVYNVPKHSAIDLIDGRSYSFVGDSALLYDDFVRNFHLQPSRISHRISLAKNNTDLKSFVFCDKQILIVDEEAAFQTLPAKQLVDLLILSKNPKFYISDLTKAFDVQQIIIDGSVPQWKAALWQKDCDSLRIPCHNVNERGAFVMTLQ